MESTELVEKVCNHSILGMPSDLMPRKTSNQRSYSVSIPERADWDQKRMELEKADIRVYSDGSKTNSGVGAGIYCNNPRTEISICLGKHSSIFQAEIHAIEICARMLNQMQLENKTIKVYSDSQAALKALESSTCISKAVWSCKNELILLGERNKITLT